MPRRHEITDAQFERIKPFLSGQPGTPGRNADNNRRSRAERWQEIFEAPQEPDLEWLVPDSTVVRGYQHAAGAKKRSRGRVSTKVHALVDALGNPLSFILTPGQSIDCPQAQPLLAFCTSDQDKAAVTAVLGDKGYDSGDLGAYVESVFEAEAMIPSRRNAKKRRATGHNLYRNRNRVGRIKQYRRVATRYEKTAWHNVYRLDLRCYYCKGQVRTLFVSVDYRQNKQNC